MTRRNVAWLVTIVVVGVLAGLRSGWAAGLLGALVVLVASEVYERARRARFRREHGAGAPSTGVRDVLKSRRR